MSHHPDSPFDDIVFRRVAERYGYADPGLDWQALGMDGFDSHENGAPAQMPRMQYYPNIDGEFGVLVVELDPQMNYANSNHGPTVIFNTAILPHTAWTALLNHPVDDMVSHYAMSGMRIVGIEHREGIGYAYTDVRLAA